MFSDWTPLTERENVIWCCRTVAETLFNSVRGPQALKIAEGALRQQTLKVHQRQNWSMICTMLRNSD